jgi:hypothetical protein
MATGELTGRTFAAVALTWEATAPHNRRLLAALSRRAARRGPGPHSVPDLVLTPGLGRRSPAAAAQHTAAGHPRSSGRRLWCAPAIPGRYLPLQMTGLRVGTSRLTIDVTGESWDVTGLDGTGIDLIPRPRHPGR